MDNNTKKESGFTTDYLKECLNYNPTVKEMIEEEMKCKLTILNMFLEIAKKQNVKGCDTIKDITPLLNKEIWDSPIRGNIEPLEIQYVPLIDILKENRRELSQDDIQQLLNTGQITLTESIDLCK